MPAEYDSYTRIKASATFFEGSSPAFFNASLTNDSLVRVSRVVPDLETGSGLRVKH